MLEPIFEADLQPEQYAYRPERSAHSAVKRVHSLLNTGHNEVVDCDLSNYFGAIPHAELLKSFARRISDGRMFGLIKAWLEMSVEEDDGAGGKRRTNRARKGRKSMQPEQYAYRPERSAHSAVKRVHSLLNTGHNEVVDCDLSNYFGASRTNRARKGRKSIPQGAPISLASNLYMRRFILGWKVRGYARHFRSEIVNYADDLCVLGKAPAAEMLAAVERLMAGLKLPVNERETRCLRCAEARRLLGVGHHRFKGVELTGQPSGQAVRQQTEGGVALRDSTSEQCVSRAGSCARRCRGGRANILPAGASDSAQALHRATPRP